MDLSKPLKYTTRWHRMGRDEGVREDLLLLLEKKFGSVRAEVRQQIEALSYLEARDKMLALLEANSLRDLGFE